MPRYPSNKVVLLLFLLVLPSTTTAAWMGSSGDLPTRRLPLVGRRESIVAISVGFWGGLLHGEPSEAATPSGLNVDNIRSRLQPSTASQPQIPLPGNIPTSTETEGSPMATVVDPLDGVEGLLYYSNTRSKRPYVTDSIVLTASSIKDKNLVLAAARLPMQKIRIPLRFRMTEQNVINSDLVDTWTKVLREEDVYLEAKVCSGSDLDDQVSAAKSLCRADPEGQLQARGVAKLLRLEKNTIRGPVSLPLA